MSPFHRAPLIDDDKGFVVTESAAILLYLTEKSVKLIPGGVQGRTCVVEWCFAAARTVGTTLDCIHLIDVFDLGNTGLELRAGVRKIASCRLSDVEQHLEGREWIACIDFTVTDIMMAFVLRGIRKTDLMNPLPKLKSCYER